MNAETSDPKIKLPDPVILTFTTQKRNSDGSRAITFTSSSIYEIKMEKRVGLLGRFEEAMIVPVKLGTDTLQRLSDETGSFIDDLWEREPEQMMDPKMKLDQETILRRLVEHWNYAGLAMLESIDPSKQGSSIGDIRSYCDRKATTVVDRTGRLSRVTFLTPKRGEQSWQTSYSFRSLEAEALQSMRIALTSSTHDFTDISLGSNGQTLHAKIVIDLTADPEEMKDIIPVEVE